MAKSRKFKIDAHGPERLEVTWTGMWKNVEVKLDGRALGEPMATFKSLKIGREFALPDGRALSVRYRQAPFGNQGLEVFIDGHPVAGSDFDPRTRLKLAVGVLGFVAGLSVLLGALGLAGVAFIQALGIGWPSIAAGAVMAALAVIGWKTRHPAPFVVALVLIVGDTVMSFAAIAGSGRIPTTGIYLRIALIVAVAGGIRSAFEARKADRRDLVDAFR